VSVNFATAPFSATSPEDFEAKSGTLTFSAGQTQQTHHHQREGRSEARAAASVLRESFQALSALITSAQGTRVIQNDDRSASNRSRCRIRRDALRRLLAGDHFLTLLRAERLLTMPRPLIPPRHSHARVYS
jgi:hypothetical protein